MTLSVPSGEKYTLSEADAAALQEIFSDDSMTMLENDPESVLSLIHIFPSARTAA